MSSDYIIKIILNYWPMFLRGAGMTLFISIIGTVLGFIIGLITGIIRTIPMPESGVQRAIIKVVNAYSPLMWKYFEGHP